MSRAPTPTPGAVARMGASGVLFAVTIALLWTVLGAVVSGFVAVPRPWWVRAGTAVTVIGSAAAVYWAYRGRD